MSKRGAGVSFMAISAFLLSSKYITSAIFGSNMEGWQETMFEIVFNSTGKFPELGKIRLAELLPSHIQNFYNKKLEEGYSAEYVGYMHSFLRKTIKRAVKLEYLSKHHGMV
jgi:hypothetical protein